MPSYMIRYQRQGERWLATVYVAESGALRPYAVLGGSWADVRRRAARLLPAILELRDHRLRVDRLNADAEPNQLA